MREVFEGIDGALRAQGLDEDGIDRSMVEALSLAYGITVEVLKRRGPLVEYARMKQKALVEAFKVLPDLRPTDVDSITRLQRAIEEYRDLVNFLTESMAKVQSPPTEDDLGDVDSLAGEEAEENQGAGEID